MPYREGPIAVDDEATRALVARARAIAREHEPREAATQLAWAAGARLVEERVEFGAWLPDLAAAPPERGPRVELELLTLPEPEGGAAGAPDPRARPGAPLRVRARRQRLPLVREGAWAWLAFRGAVLGRRERLGTLYRVLVRSPDGREEVVHDPLAISLPFGPRGPAELYDLPRLHADRPDAEYFRRVGLAGDDEAGDPPRAGLPAHLLEVHVGTATHGGTLADLADLYRALAAKVRAGEEPTPGERVFLGHDAVELLPIEPVAADPAAPPRCEVAGEGPEAELALRPPASANWGYDTVLHGAAAIEPALLRSGRPDELVDLAGVLHGFPGKPIRLVLDVVLGHAHPQAHALLPAAFFAGEGSYGPRPDLGEPVVRALLLEAVRRKAGLGADGLRVDASHDLAAPDGAPDDAFLAALGDVVARAGEVRYRPFAIFEDGRPAPRGPRAFREPTARQPHALQWGPLAYGEAHPALAGWWGSAWWRIRAAAEEGERWVGGFANHDTLRAAYLVRDDLPANGRLGADRPEILRRAFDHPAAQLLSYGLLPGVPLTFVAALLRAPWAFFRDLDRGSAARVAAAEAGALAWRFGPAAYAEAGAFARLKGLGFADHGAALAFFRGLAALARDGAAAPAALAEAARRAGPPAPFVLDATSLEAAGRAYLLDLRDACVAWNGERHLDPAWVASAHALRRARAERPWLAAALREGDRLARRVLPDGSLRVTGVRHAPDGGESLALLANLEGEAWTVVPAEELQEEGWAPLAASPGAAWRGEREPLVLGDAEGVLLRRET